MDAMHKGLDVSIYAKPELFPAPREVDRFLYGQCDFCLTHKKLVSVPSRGR